MPLTTILQTLRDLEIGSERELSDHLMTCIRNKLLRSLGPPVLPKPKPKPRPKTARRPNISEETWAEYMGMRKKLKRQKAQVAA